MDKMTSHTKILNQVFGSVKPNFINGGYTVCNHLWSSNNYLFEYDSIGIVLDGSIWLKYDDIDFVVDKGELYYFPGNTIQSFKIHNCKKAIKYWCHFTAQIGENSLFDMVEYPTKIKCKDVHKVINIFKEMLKTYHNEYIGNSFYYNSKLYELIHEYIYTAGNQITLRKNQLSQDMYTINEYIEKHINKNISVKELADLAGFSTNYFIEIFKNYFNMTPLQYIINKKIVLAKSLLTCTNMSIKEISIHLGFSSQNYFSEIFKAQTNFSPSIYRKLHI
ncbi:helix-turn-helix transcriptional regulator [Vallitalea guaymasensis]|uniref:Helix-turn-helix transcriptional regulator n=2 Tax=Vallitalea guaymasensis TaxID=1185412 RepID=A0A8J8SE55_9FIRM|nr:helix-turn-helix transcriptional regulator [Vallitalea guaymasensis]